MGKRNLVCREAQAVAVTVTNTKTKESVTIRPSEALLKLLSQMEAAPKAGAAATQEHHDTSMKAAETIGRKIAVMPQGELVESPSK